VGRDWRCGTAASSVEGMGGRMVTAVSEDGDIDGFGREGLDDEKVALCKADVEE